MPAEASWLLSVVAFTVAIVGTPGPNNLMVMASGTNFGFVRTIPHMLGIVIGVPLIFLFIAFLGQPLFALPWLRETLRICGILYLLWLAFRLAMTRPMRRDDGPAAAAKTAPLSIWQAAAFQWVNPQVWLTAGAALVGYAYVDGASSNSNAVKLALIFGLVAAPCVAAWTMMGEVAARFLKSDRSVVIFNRCMAALLVLSLIGLL